MAKKKPSSGRKPAPAARTRRTSGAAPKKGTRISLFDLLEKKLPTQQAKALVEALLENRQSLGDFLSEAGDFPEAAVKPPPPIGGAAAAPAPPPATTEL